MDKIVLCFEVNNKQESFSALMQMIDEIENGKVSKKCEELYSEYPAHYCWLRGKDAFHNEQDIVRGIEAQIAGKDVEQQWKLHSIRNIAQVAEGRNKYKISYYVRILPDGDIKNAQYIILMLQQLKGLRGKIQFFFVPFLQYYNATEKSEWKGKNIYYKFSHFLRFALPKYRQTFFGAYFNGSRKCVEIMPLSRKKAGVQSTFFPLIEIDETVYSVVTKHCVINKRENEEEEKEKSSLMYELIEISGKMLETRYYKEHGRSKEAREKIGYVNAGMQTKMITVLEYALLSVLTPVDVELEDDDIVALQNRAGNIADGLVQIMENIILHSHNHKGIFTFYINGDEERKLKIDISDANVYETIIDNFTQKLGMDASYFEKIQLSIAQFFQNYSTEEEEMAWEIYRKENPVRCMGLRRLNEELEKCDALLFVRSNIEYAGDSDRLFFYADYKGESKSRNKDTLRYIPGTQFHIVIPMDRQLESEKQHNANIFLYSIGSLTVTDKAYAKFIECAEKKIDFGELMQRYGEIELLDVVDADNLCTSVCREGTNDNQKERMVQFWIQSWNEWADKIKKEENIVYVLDLKGCSELESGWGIEVLCKGIVGSNVVKNCNIKYFAMINASDEFIKMFFTTFIFADLTRNEQLQIYLHSDNKKEDFLIAGKDSKDIVRNAYQFCFTKGKIPEFLHKYKMDESDTCRYIDLFPFEVIISQQESRKTLFEEYIENVADNLLTSRGEAGYLLENTHMRLGNKVHLKEFYELSILFRKPHIAKKLALLIIRTMRSEGVDIMQNILFYGYASYSRDILAALVEIVEQYYKLKAVEPFFAQFAVYQNDIMIQKTLTDISPKARMYFSQKIPENTDIQIVQIVPISTTLTTFKKMWDIFGDEKRIDKTRMKLAKNYTLFWVKAKEEDGKPSLLAKEYWERINEDRTIVTSLISPPPRFFCCRETEWHNPLNCELCYPLNILDEIALVETDATSTVPSQQLEVFKNRKKTDESNMSDCEKEEYNELRIINLKDCVYYGHISRDGNHFQYYIDTIAYFQKNKEEIAHWLERMREDDRSKEDKQDCINIIVTPQHHTNVEFGHYVNEYYFEGTADVITIDPAKEYRSNIIVKYADVKAAIEKAYEIDKIVKFIYVDDTIITGTTFRRVNNLLHSLVPDKKMAALQIDKVFVLINRLSLHSKAEYVNRIREDFCAFVELNISSIRNFGDSCTMCTLRRNSKLFMKRASTASVARYWDEKHFNYRTISFDKYAGHNNCDKMSEQGYLRMLCSHYAKSTLNITENMEENICGIITLMLDLQLENRDSDAQISKIYTCVFHKNVLEALKAYLKVLVRPFFSYGHIYRQAMLDLLLMITEYFINPEFKKNLQAFDDNLSNTKIYLNGQHLRHMVSSLCIFIQELIKDQDQVEFIQTYMIDGLVDLRSNYPIRKNTLLNMRLLIEATTNPEKRYEIYGKRIHRLINSNADETKSLWFEYLLTTGQENTTNMNDSERIRRGEVWNERGNFRKFWERLFIENTRLYYDSMLNFVQKAETLSGDIQKAVELLWNDYYISNMRRFIKIETLIEDNANTNSMIRERIEKTANLLWVLKKETTAGMERYEKLKDCFEQMLFQEDSLWIFTTAFAGEDGKTEICSVTDYKSGRVPDKIIENLEKAMKNEQLQNESFCIGDDFVVICIDNNFRFFQKKQIVSSSQVRIEPVYFYIQCTDADRYRMIVRIRMILMYRHQILHWVEADFNNNALPILANQMNINRQLMRDKAGDHSSKTDISSVERLLQTEYDSSLEGCYRWLLLRQYVNMRIARVFRSEWSEEYNCMKERLYSPIKNADKMNKPMVNLGKSFFDYTLKPMSPRYYLNLVWGLFEFHVCIEGKKYKKADNTELKKFFEQLYGRVENGYYYKQEYIICMIFDILFSAIRTCRNWKIERDKYQDTSVHYLIKENVTMMYYYQLSKDEEKCRIWIGVEPIEGSNVLYLVLRNKVEEIRKEDIERENEDIKKKLNTKETKGLSLQAIKWYTENLGEEKSEKAVFQYEWNIETNETEFVTKLPILSRKEME